MATNGYLAALLDLYLDAPDTPTRASRSDRRIARDLYREGVSLDHIAHAIRVATLRRRGGSHPPIRSLAYYRTVLQRLSDDELKADYVGYVRHAYSNLQLNSKPRTHSRNTALCDRR